MDIQPITNIYSEEKKTSIYEYPRQVYGIPGTISSLAFPQILDLSYIIAAIPKLIIPGNIQYRYSKITLDLFTQIEISDDNSVSWPLVAKDFCFGSIVPNEYIKINGSPNPIMLTKSNTSFYYAGPLQNVSIEKIQFEFMSDIINYVNNPVSSLAPFTNPANSMGVSVFIRPIIQCYW